MIAHFFARNRTCPLGLTENMPCETAALPKAPKQAKNKGICAIFPLAKPRIETCKVQVELKPKGR
jgi:hypothetical protein